MGFREAYDNRREPADRLAPYAIAPVRRAWDTALRMNPASRLPCLVLGLLLPLALAAQPAAPPGSPPQLVALLAQCQTALPQADALRHRAVREAMLRLRLSLSWRRAPGQLSPEEKQSAIATERGAYRQLVAACKPLLI